MYFHLSNKRHPRHTTASYIAWIIRGKGLCNSPCHRPHSRQVTGARCTGGRGSPVMSWILPKANNEQQTSGVGDKRFFRFKRNAYHLWTAILRHRLNDIIHQQVVRFNQSSKFAIIFKVHLKHPQCFGTLAQPPYFPSNTPVTGSRPESKTWRLFYFGDLWPEGLLASLTYINGPSGDRQIGEKSYTGNQINVSKWILGPYS